MPDSSARLSLPFLLPAQAQKHVTHNEALDLLDLLVQMAIEAFDALTPPASPVEGPVWALGAAPTGDWAGQGGRLASWRNGAWAFVTPGAGWIGWDRAGDRLRVFSGTAWEPALRASDLQNLSGLGVNTTSDATNRLAVSAAATLLTHEGAGHQLKINKAATTDTASLLFQTGWSGRAEMGLAGSDSFAIKVSADGAGFATALSAASSGIVSLPAGVRVADGTAAAPSISFEADTNTGLRRPASDQIGFVTGGTQRALLSSASFQVNVPLAGTAVQSTATDATAGRVMTVGAFGLGAASGLAAPLDDANLCVNAGIAYRFTTAGTNTPGTPYGGSLIVTTGSSGDIQQMFFNREGTRAWLRGWSSATATWSGWQRLLSNDLLLGTVAQSGGVPTGAVIERGSGANGAWVRFADGTMTCTRSGLSAANASTAEGALYRSADVGWTFPSAFAEAPVVTGAVDDIDCWISAALPTATGCTVRVRSALAKAAALNIRLVAHGRWF
ncbi:MAG: DUF2793 domain-containing protein [Paracoccaceae bacterium]